MAYAPLGVKKGKRERDGILLVCFCRSFITPLTLYRSYRRRALTLPVRANPGCEGLNVPAEKPSGAEKNPPHAGIETRTRVFCVPLRSA